MPVTRYGPMQDTDLTRSFSKSLGPLTAAAKSNNGANDRSIMCCVVRPFDVLIYRRRSQSQDQKSRPRLMNLCALINGDFVTTRAASADVQFANSALLMRANQKHSQLSYPFSRHQRRLQVWRTSGWRIGRFPTQIWIATDVCLSAFVLEVDLRLIERRVKQVIGMMLHARSGRRADAQPVQPQGVAAGDPVLASSGRNSASASFCPR